MLQPGKGRRDYKEFTEGEYSHVFNRGNAKREIFLDDKKYALIGSLFQGQFKAVHVNRNNYLLHLSAYIHVNPKTAGIVDDVLEWKYSSYPEYLGTCNEGMCDTKIILGQFSSIAAYNTFAQESVDITRRAKEIEARLFAYGDR